MLPDKIDAPGGGDDHAGFRFELAAKILGGLAGKKCAGRVH
jgi:hypothetical protein